MTDGEFKMTIYYEGSDDLKDFLAHDGVKNMKWHNRRYQYPDGSLTPLGRQHYGVGPPRKKKDPTVNLQADSKRADRIAKTGNIHQGPKKNNGGESEGGTGKKGGPFDQTIKGGKDKPNISPMQSIAKDTSYGIQNAQKATETYYNMKRRGEPKEPIEMTDAELRRAINRINMEKQYRSLLEEDTKSGYQTCMDVLTIAGALVGVASASVGIISTVREMTKK